jgi:hypothetical protein
LRDCVPDHRNPQSEQLEEGLVEAEPVVVAVRVPALELHHQFDALRAARRRDAEQIAQVDHAEAADFHVMAGQLRGAADDDRRGASPHLHRIVGHETMATDDEIERALALADAALTDNEHPEAQNVHQHAVDDLAHGEPVLE